jgi:two-component system sensor histidine kinase UhpB
MDQTFGRDPRRKITRKDGVIKRATLNPAGAPVAGRQLRGVPDVRRQLQEERERIARDLHDDLGQMLAALKIGLEGIGAAVSHGEKPDEITARLRSLSREVEGAIGSLRKVILNLRPPMLERLGLAAAIESQALVFRSRTGIPCKTSGLEYASRLRGNKAKAAFRFIEEALTNVARHADADEAAIEISQSTGRRLSLCVKDNGRGMDPFQAVNSGGLGLMGARERASQLGGRLEIRTVPPHGLAVRLDLPL